METKQTLAVVPDIENVLYIDEYPELKQRVLQRRRLQEQAGLVVRGNLILFPCPDGVA